MCATFVFAVLTVTAIWVYSLRPRDFPILAYAMFFPGLFALLFSLFDGSILQFLWNSSGLPHPLHAVIYSASAIPLVYAIVETCAFVATACGWGKTVEISSKSTGIHGHNKDWIHGFLRAGGEELGWRCYLLPCLMEIYRPEYALLLSGIAWGLFHVPVMVLLASKLQTPKPYRTVAVQCASCILAAFPHGWLAIKSGYSIWPPTVMHWYWNRYNPTVLGSIYMNTPGRLHGPQWLINGEGLTGCLVMLPVAIGVMFELGYDLF